MEDHRPVASRLGRLLDACVALGLGLTAGVLLGARFGPVAAILGGLALLLVALRVLRRLGSRSRLAYRLLLLAWLAFAGVQGIERAAFRPPGPPRAAGDGAAASPRPFAAGLGSAAFELPARATMAGWGTRPRRRALPAWAGLGGVGRLSLAWMGPPAPGEAPRVPIFRRPEAKGPPIGARAVVIRPEGAPPFGLVRLDLILVPPRLARRVVEAVADLGFEDATLLVQASHTHSGPGGAFRAPLAEALGTDHFDVAVFDAVVAAAVGAVREADRVAVPARVTALEASDRGDDGLPVLARTRGRQADLDPAGDAERIDPRVLALRLEERASGRPIALIVHYAVQPVMLRPRHLVFGSDLPGAIENALEERLPGHPPVLFLNGHCGDVTPRRDGLSGPDGAGVLARRFAENVAADLAKEGALRTRIAVHAARDVRDLGTPFAFAALGSRSAFERHVLAGPFGRDAPQAFASALCLPANLLVWGLGLPEVRVGFTFGGAVGAAVRLDDAVPAGETAAGAVVLESEAGAEAVFLWHPAVATQALLRRWRADVAQRDLPAPFVLGATGGAIGYLVTAEEYAEGRYEALASLHGSEGARLVREMLFDALGRARRELGRE